MNSEDKGWIKWIVLALIAGALVGKIISVILDLFLPEAWVLLVTMVTPASIIIALIIVLYLYQRAKDDTL